MVEYYNLKNIRDLLTRGFSEDELRRLCLYEEDFRPLHTQLSQEASRETIADQIIDYSYQKLHVDQLLAWAEKQNPGRFARHKPYHHAETTTLESGFVLLETNHLGYEITLGGTYRNISLKIIAAGWEPYGTSGKVRSGWLYVPQLTASHAVTFFKIHISNDGKGYIHLVDAAHPIHPIWLRTRTGSHTEKEFHYISHPTDIWHFVWKETDLSSL